MENPSTLYAAVGRLIDENSWTRYQKVVWLIAALAFLSEGVAGQSMGLALPGIIRDWHLTRTAFALPTALGLMGFACGAFFGGNAGDRFGRRTVLVASLLVLGVFTMICGEVANIGQLSAIRVLQGLGLGGALPASVAIISEFAPARHRSIALALGISFLPTGGIVAGELASYVLPIAGWRGVFFWCGIMALGFAALAAVVLPESPRFLATRANSGAAVRRAMARIGRPLGDGALDDSAETRRAAPIKDIVKPDLRRNTVLLWVGYFFVVLCLYSMFSWLPALLADRGLPLPTASRAISAMSVGGLIGGLASGWFIHRFGSRASLAGLGIAAAAAAIWLIGITGQPMINIGLLSIAVGVLGGTISGAQTVLYTQASHIYSPQMRSTGIGIAVAWGRVGAVLSAFTGVLSINMGGSAMFFAVIAVAVILVVVAGTAIFPQLPGARTRSGEGHSGAGVGSKAAQ